MLPDQDLRPEKELKLLSYYSGLKGIKKSTNSIIHPKTRNVPWTHQISQPSLKTLPRVEPRALDLHNRLDIQQVFQGFRYVKQHQVRRSDFPCSVDNGHISSHALSSPTLHYTSNERSILDWIQVKDILQKKPSKQLYFYHRESEDIVLLCRSIRFNKVPIWIHPPGVVSSLFSFDTRWCLNTFLFMGRFGHN